MTKYDASDRTTICPNTGTGTYTLRSGSVYCPSESCAPGGHFLRRVAFARLSEAAAEIGQPITAQPKPIAARRTAVAPKPKVEDVFASGFDAFIGDGK